MTTATTELVKRKQENEAIQRELRRREDGARGLAGDVARSLRAHSTDVSRQLRKAGVSARRSPTSPMQRYSGDRSFPVEGTRLEVAGGSVEILPRADLQDGIARIRVRISELTELPNLDELEGVEILQDHGPEPTALVVDAHDGTLTTELTGDSWSLRNPRPGHSALTPKDAVGVLWHLVGMGLGIRRASE